MTPPTAPNRSFERHQKTFSVCTEDLPRHHGMPPRKKGTKSTAGRGAAAQEASDIFWVFSFFFSWHSAHLFQADPAGEQQSGAKQHRPSASILYSGWLMKMLNSAAFYTLSGDIPATFLIHLGHSCYIRSKFEVFQQHFVWILERSNRTRQTFREHSYSIRGIFQIQNQALFGQQSNCTRMAFEVHSEHYNSILSIPTVFQLLSSCVRELMHSECARIIRCGFVVNS